jgi:hypothetical protein
MKFWFAFVTFVFEISTGFAQSPLPAQQYLTANSTISEETLLAQETKCPPAWSVRLVPYMWALSMEGDVTVRGVTAPVDVSIGKVLDLFLNDLNFAAIGQIEAKRGRIGFLVNGIYADVSPGSQIRRLDFSTRFRTSLIDVLATYELEGVHSWLSLPPEARFELLAGFRFNSLSSGLTVTGPRGNSATASGTEDWFDPILGARFRLPLCQNLTAQVRGDVGGFGIGEASQFVWNLEAILEYRCTSRASLFAGYRVLDIDYTSGSGSRRFGFDMTLSGPLAGLALDF